MLLVRHICANVCVLPQSLWTLARRHAWLLSAAGNIPGSRCAAAAELQQLLNFYCTSCAACACSRQRLQLLLHVLSAPCVLALTAALHAQLFETGRSHMVVLTRPHPPSAAAPNAATDPVGAGTPAAAGAAAAQPHAAPAAAPSNGMATGSSHPGEDNAVAASRFSAAAAGKGEGFDQGVAGSSQGGEESAPSCSSYARSQQAAGDMAGAGGSTASLRSASTFANGGPAEGGLEDAGAANGEVAITIGPPREGEQAEPRLDPARPPSAQPQVRACPVSDLEY